MDYRMDLSTFIQIKAEIGITPTIQIISSSELVNRFLLESDEKKSR